MNKNYYKIKNPAFTFHCPLCGIQRGLRYSSKLGFKNYILLFTQDPNFGASALHTLYLTMGVLIFSLILGFILAVLLLVLQQNKFQNLFKGIFFFPHIISQVVIGIIFRGTMFEVNFGYVNKILGFLGLDFMKLDWLGNPYIAIYSVTAAFIYAQVGFAMVIYYTSLLALPEEIFDAVRIDGASFLQTISRLILPLLKNTHKVLVIFSIVASTKLFDLIWMMTEGGPASSTEIISTYIYRQSMLFYKQGNASAISSIVLFVILGFSILFLSIQFPKKKSRM